MKKMMILQELEDRLVDFAVEVIAVVEALPGTQFVSANLSLVALEGTGRPFD
jgi:hypothetical protein